MESRGARTCDQPSMGRGGVMLSREQLQRAAADTGFQVESYERVDVLVRLREAVRTHPFLGSRMALKGGTALNLFLLGLPRLSVDIDLNYVGASERATMLAERPRVERALEQVAGRMGLTVKRAPTEHAGGKWRLTYTTGLGRPGSIEVDVNFMLRTPLWPAAPKDSHAIGGEKATMSQGRRRVAELREHAAEPRRLLQDRRGHALAHFTEAHPARLVARVPGRAPGGHPASARRQSRCAPAARRTPSPRP